MKYTVAVCLIEIKCDKLRNIASHDPIIYTVYCIYSMCTVYVCMYIHTLYYILQFTTLQPTCYIR